jgi:GntR family transcriptional regulator / MocR family aminotransferase
MMEPIDLEPLFPDRTSSEPLNSQLVRRLRNAIESGALAPQTRLLASRELAKRLGVARNTATFAIDQLIAEGYLEARVGAGTFVTKTLVRRAPHAVRPRSVPKRARAYAALKQYFTPIAHARGALRPGMPDVNTFPRRAWKIASRERFNRFYEDLQYGPAAGLRELRDAISTHVRQFRGVATQPQNVIVTEGAQAAMHLLSLVLAASYDTIAVEDPGYNVGFSAFRARELRLHPVRVDKDGLMVEELPAEAAFAVITPSHQFPLGGALPLARRLRLLAWARERNCYIVEDDYDSEYWFDGRPLPALQSLDRDERVIYVGTFSKTLAPGLRVGYIIAPPHLAQALRVARAATSLGVSVQLQSALAAFISQGHFARHVRRTMNLYSMRRQALIHTLTRELPAAFSMRVAQGGLHISIVGPRWFDDAASSVLPGQRLVALSPLCLRRRDVRGFMLGFCTEEERAVKAAAHALCESLNGLS